MFKGKIYAYSNINGKEKKIEREFDDPREYQEFISSNRDLGSFALSGPSIFDSMFDFNNYLEDFFNSKMALGSPVNGNIAGELESGDDLPVDLSSYEKELNKIDEEKKKKTHKKNLLEKTLEKLKGYLDKFKNEKRNDLVKKVEEDIKKVKKDLEELK